MPLTCTLVGHFTKHEQPVQGLVRCTPERLWVIEHDVPWACLAPTVQLDQFGVFRVQLTPTDADYVPWKYILETPAGAYRVALPWREKHYNLRELIDAHRAVPWTPHG